MAEDANAIATKTEQREARSSGVNPYARPPRTGTFTAWKTNSDIGAEPDYITEDVACQPLENAVLVTDLDGSFEIFPYHALGYIGFRYDDAGE